MNGRSSRIGRASAGGGGSTLTTLFLIFLVLKLVGKIDWSWWWVTCPLWGGAALVFGGAALIGIVVGLVILGAFLLDRFQEWRRR